MQIPFSDVTPSRAVAGVPAPEDAPAACCGRCVGSPAFFGNHTDKVRPLTPKRYVAASRLSRKNFLRPRVNLSTSGWQGWPRQLPPRLPGRAAMDAHPRR
jgi:hypothetical protein